MQLLLVHRGYNIWADVVQGTFYYGISRISDPKPNQCSYKYLHAMLKLKGL